MKFSENIKNIINEALNNKEAEEVKAHKQHAATIKKLESDNIQKTLNIYVYCYLLQKEAEAITENQQKTQDEANADPLYNTYKDPIALNIWSEFSKITQLYNEVQSDIMILSQRTGINYEKLIKEIEAETIKRLEQ